MTSHLDPNRVDKILRELKPNALEYLRVYYLAGQRAQFMTCARKMGISEQTFANGLHDLNAKIFNLSGGVHLLKRVNNGWELTSAGTLLGERLAESRLQLYETLDEARESLTVWVRLANDCWPEWGQLARAMQGSDVTVLPYPVRSTELHLHRPDAPPPETPARSHALYTTCLDVTTLRQDPEKKCANLTMAPGTEVVETRRAPFEILLRKEIVRGWANASHASLVAEGVGLLLPDEGAVIDYLNLLEPPWASARVKRYRGGTDFDHCLGALRSGSYPHAAMIVHGLPEKLIPTNYTTIQLSDMPDVKAVTGFYRRQVPTSKDQTTKPWPNETEEAWLTVWSRALKHLRYSKEAE